MNEEQLRDMLTSIFNCPRYHIPSKSLGTAEVDHWDIRLPNPLFCEFVQLCKSWGLKKIPKGPAITPRTTKEEKQQKRMQRKGRR